MKKQKQNKIKPSEPQTFVAAAQAAAQETARRVADKLAVLTHIVLIEGNLEKASDHAVSVYQRYENINTLRYLVLDVLVNPDKLPAMDSAKFLYNETLPEIASAKLQAPSFKNGYWAKLQEMVHDYKAISCVFRVSVLIGEDGKAGNFTACSYHRNDRIGELNAVQYGSKTGVERLLVLPLNMRPAYDNSHGAVKVACTIGFARYHQDANVERIIDSAVEICDPYSQVGGETVRNCLENLTTEKIQDSVKQCNEHAELVARLFSMVREIEFRTGLKVVQGPRLTGPDWTMTATIAVMAPHDDWNQSLDFSKLFEARDSLEALHEALVK